ncbi:MAG: TIGR00730 family Rossman fold protein [Sandaracinobacter sp.]
MGSGEIRSVLVFCGSRPGQDQGHALLAATVGRMLADHGVALVYGGGALGLMGEIGRAALAGGGAVRGVIPRFLKDWEMAEPQCTDMTVVDSLHTRKAVMFEQADAVLALPGGLGTLDELVEVLSWRNLRLHARPVWLMGDTGFWQPFLALLRHTVDTGFSSPEILTHVRYLPDTDALAAALVQP